MQEEGLLSLPNPALWAKGSFLDDSITTVVDVTYLCNATCKYCQWGNKKNPMRQHLGLEDVLLSKETLEAIGTNRVVISGGEPRLHPDLQEILSYYRKLVASVIIISNGYGLNKREVLRLVDYGATGVTVSLDSTSSEESVQTRETAPVIHKQILSNLEEISEQPRNFELGINSVVSHVTANWETVRELLDFGERTKVDFIKFQPIFNDGYVELNAPHLMLASKDVPKLLEISRLIENIQHPPTNPASFWTDLASLAEGKSLPSNSCGLGSRQSIAMRGKVGICFWLEKISFGDIRSNLRKETVIDTRRRFEEEKLSCKVNYQCFCTQSLSHVWGRELLNGKTES